MDTPQDNLLTALEWTLRYGDLATALQMIGALGPFWRRGGHYQEGRRWLEEALRRAQAARPDVQARLAYEAGMLCLEQGDLPAAEAYFAQALQIAQMAGDAREAAHALAGLGQVALAGGRLDQARAHFEASLNQRERLGDLRAIARSLVNLGLVALAERDYPAAEALFRRSLTLQSETEDSTGQAQSFILLGEVARARSENVVAGEWYNQALTLAREVGEADTIAWTLHNQGHLARHQSDLVTAVGLFRESLAWFQPQAHHLGPLACLAGLAGILVAQGDLEGAARLLGAVQAGLAERGLRLPPVDQIEFDQTLARVRAGLAEADWITASSAGQTLPVETLIRETLTRLTPSSAPATLTAQLRLFALGSTRVYRGEQLIAPAEWRYTKTKELLFYLLSQGPATKDQIGLALWPEASHDQLRRHLHRTLHALRQVLDHPARIRFENGVYSFNRDLPYQYDVEELEGHLDPLTNNYHLSSQVAYLISLYSGDFLSDLDVGAWATVERERLRQGYLTTLVTVGQRLLDQNDPVQAAVIFRAAIAWDAYLEEAHCGLMRSLARQGETVQAIRHYEALVRLLREDLKTAPSLETQQVYEQMRDRGKG